MQNAMYEVWASRRSSAPDSPCPSCGPSRWCSPSPRVHRDHVPLRPCRGCRSRAQRGGHPCRRGGGLPDLERRRVSGSASRSRRVAVPWRELRTGSAIAAVCWQILQVVAATWSATNCTGPRSFTARSASCSACSRGSSCRRSDPVRSGSGRGPRPSPLAKIVLPATADQPAQESEPAQETRRHRKISPLRKPMLLRRTSPFSRAGATTPARTAGLAWRGSLVAMTGLSGGPAPVPPPRGEPSASDKKAGSAR